LSKIEILKLKSFQFAKVKKHSCPIIVTLLRKSQKIRKNKIPSINFYVILHLKFFNINA